MNTMLPLLKINFKFAQKQYPTFPQNGRWISLGKINNHFHCLFQYSVSHYFPRVSKALKLKETCKHSSSIGVHRAILLACRHAIDGVTCGVKAQDIAAL
jgi:hypothetical protein